VWSHLIETDKAILRVLAGPELSADSSNQDFSGSVQELKSRGATHLVFGEYEKSLFPKTTVGLLASASNGRIVFQKGEFGIIELR
jgi:hypothetical protein